MRVNENVSSVTESVLYFLPVFSNFNIYFYNDLFMLHFLQMKNKFTFSGSKRIYFLVIYVFYQKL